MHKAEHVAGECMPPTESIRRGEWVGVALQVVSLTSSVYALLCGWSEWYGNCGNGAQVYNVDELMAMVLHYVHVIGEAYGEGAIKDVVLTVPA
jgi:hypothetical protein